MSFQQANAIAVMILLVGLVCLVGITYAGRRRSMTPAERVLEDQADANTGGDW